MNDNAESGHLLADTEALCLAMLNAAAGGPEPDIDVAVLISRHGLDPLAEILTSAARRPIDDVAAQRGNITPTALLDGYLDKLFKGQANHVRDAVAGQVLNGLHPPIPDPDDQEIFVWALVSLHVRALLDLKTSALDDPLAPVRPGFEHRPARPVYSHDCTPRCQPWHEHPGLGCRGLHAEITARRKRRG